jgi:hypothetical protein
LNLLTAQGLCEALYHLPAEAENGVVFVQFNVGLAYGLSRSDFVFQLEIVSQADGQGVGYASLISWQEFAVHTVTAFTVQDFSLREIAFCSGDNVCIKNNGHTAGFAA